MIESLHINLLGNLTITIGDKPLKKFPSRAAEAIIAYLALSPHPVPREQLIDLIWETSAPKQGAANLRSILSSLRRALGDYLSISREAIGFRHNGDLPIMIDAVRFSAEMAQLNTLNDSAIEATLTLYRDEFLTGFHLRDGRRFEEWVVFERERLAQLSLRGLQRMVQHKLNSAEYSSGIRYARQWLQIDPYSEAAHRQLMWLLMRDGQRNAALRQYRICWERLQTDIGVEPTPATTQLFDLLRSIPTPAVHHLPIQSTTFVGRHDEMADLLGEIARPDRRLMTLLGLGGIGKTRLAIAFAERLVHTRPGTFLHGIHFVPLAAVTQAAQIPFAIADVLDVRLEGRDSAEKQLIHQLEQHELLLILDNFEQLATNDDALDLITNLLAQLPKLKLLVTSRVRLQLIEEVVFQLQGLALPLDKLEEYALAPAIQLFIDRAQRVNRRFVVAKGQFEIIADTCRLVEGTPLAIELAASNMHAYSLDDVAHQLADSFHLLETSHRNVPPRHRSLRAVFEHSWRLLGQHEQLVFAKLSIFPDSFDAAAAHAVANASRTMLVTLCNKSLLQTSDRVRFAIHPLLRDFSAEYLSPTLAVKCEHAYVRHYAHQLSQLKQRDIQFDHAALTTDAPNIERMWRLAIAQQNSAALQQASQTLFQFYAVSGRPLEAIQLFSDALASTNDDAVMLTLRLQRGRLHTTAGNLQHAIRDLEAVRHHPLIIEQPDSHIEALAYLAVPYLYQGKFDYAKSLAEESLQLAESAEMADQIAFALNVLGGCHKSLGELAAARRCYERVVSMRQALNDGLSIGRVMNNLGNLAQVGGEFDIARAYYREASDIFRLFDRPFATAVTASNAGRLAWQAGDLVEARRFLTEAVAIRRGLSTQGGLASSLINLSLVAVDEGEVTESAELLTEALRLSQQATSIAHTLEILLVHARLLRSIEQAGDMRLLSTVWHHPALTNEVRLMATDLLEQAARDSGALPTPFATLDAACGWSRANLKVILHQMPKSM